MCVRIRVKSADFAVKLTQIFFLQLIHGKMRTFATDFAADFKCERPLILRHAQFIRHYRPL